MYEKLFEHAEGFFKPFGEIMSLQAETLEALSQKQSAMMSGMWDDSVSYAQHLPEQKSLDSLMKYQQSYLDECNSRWRTTTEESMEILNATNEKIGTLLQDTFPASANAMTTASKEATKAAKKVSAPAKKAAKASSSSSTRRKTGSSSTGTAKKSTASTSASSDKSSTTATETEAKS